MRIPTENLASALTMAIKSAGDEDKKNFGPDFECGLVKGWKEVLEAIKRGEQVWVSDK